MKRRGKGDGGEEPKKRRKKAGGGGDGGGSDGEGGKKAVVKRKRGAAEAAADAMDRPGGLGKCVGGAGDEGGKLCVGGWMSVWRGELGRLQILGVEKAAAAAANRMDLSLLPCPYPASTGEYDPRRAEIELARRQEARQDIKAAHKALILASSG